MGDIKKCFSLEFENESQLLSFLNNLFLEHEEIYRIAQVFKFSSIKILKINRESKKC